MLNIPLKCKIMNAKRRKDIEKAVELLYEAKSMLETSLEEEKNAFDNLPEGIQCSERGEKMEEYIGYIEDTISSIEDSIENAEYCYN